jgi:hypothetical protein
MDGTVVSVARHCIMVRIDGEDYGLHLRSEWIERDGSTYLLHGFDIAYGYALTIHKAQGSTLSSGILVFESYAPPGWGYTALTRFRTRESLLILGPVCEQHFIPRPTFER